MTRLKTSLLTIAMLLFSLAASAHDFVVDGIYYYITSSTDLTVCVTYKGSSYNSEVYSGSVVIPEKVKYNNKEYSVTSIGGYAFYGCSGLVSVDIPNSVTSIEGLAFYYCSKLTKIDIPNSVTSIGNEAFEGCSGLTSITIPNSIKFIGSEAFYDCRVAKTVHISDLSAWCKIDFYDAEANPASDGSKFLLNGEELTDLVIPDDVTKVEEYAFYGFDKLTSVEIPETCERLYAYSFAYCSNLKTVILPSSCLAVYDCSFYNSYPTSIYCKAETAPVAYKSSFGSYNATLYIPKGSVDSYLEAAYWCKFSKIEELPVAESVVLDKTSVILKEDSEITLSATVLPAEAVNKNITWTSSDETVATVDNGIVRAIRPGKAIITVKAGTVSATCEVTVKETINIYMSASSVNLYPDTQFDFSISMNNDVEISAFQCDIYIPEGVTLQKNSKGKYDITLNTERSDDHTISTALQSDGAIRVVVVSMTSSVFSGSEGALLNLNMLTGEELGDYTVEVRNICISNTAGELCNLEDIYGVIKIDYKPGDANGDGIVVVNDAVYTINRILGVEAADFKFTAADMNSDGNILVNDVVLIVNTILGIKPSTVVLAPRHMNAFETLSVSDSRTAYGMTEFGITLSNASRYTAMQFDMELAEGADIADIKVSMPTDHSVAYRRIDDTTVRVVVTSLTNEVLADVAQLCISMKDAAGKTVAFTNGRAACNNGQMVGIMPDSTVLGGTTGIDGVNAEFAPADVYSIDGKVVKKNANTLDDLKPGVYVVNGRKVVKS